MNRLILAVTVAVALQSYAVGCPTGSVEYNGNCYTDLQPEKDTTPSVKPSDEKAPRLQRQLISVAR